MNVYYEIASTERPNHYVIQEQISYIGLSYYALKNYEKAVEYFDSTISYINNKLKNCEDDAKLCNDQIAVRDKQITLLNEEISTLKTKRNIAYGVGIGGTVLGILLAILVR